MNGGSIMNLLIAGALLLAIAFLVLALRRLSAAKAERDSLRTAQEELIARFKGVLDAEAERTRILDSLKHDREEAIAASEHDREVRMKELEQLGSRRDVAANEIASLHLQIEALRRDLSSLDEESTLQSFGFYKPRYQFVDSARYQAELEKIREAQKVMLKQRTAASCRIEWTVNGSKVEGRKQINQTINLMLRAFNGESDAAVAKVKFNNVTVMEARIRKAYERINGLAEVQKCLISQSYFSLKLQELFLAHEYQEKLQEEREEQRHIREQIREEEIAQRQLEKARLEAEREETRYEQALSRAREEVERSEGANREKLSAQIAELQQRLEEARAAKERAISQAQLTRSGNVYIISNIGSFGEDVFKIGMTRRLDPYDRVHELSGAAVPFDFDVHAMIRSVDAPALENKLHRIFHLRRLNRINERREFFRVTLDEILLATGLPVADIEVTKIAEAEDYRKTLALLEEEGKKTLVISRTATTTSSGDIVAQLQSPLVAISPTATSAAPYSSSPELAGRREGV
jgi:hypothetical protein